MATPDSTTPGPTKRAYTKRANKNAAPKKAAPKKAAKKSAAKKSTTTKTTKRASQVSLNTLDVMVALGITQFGPVNTTVMNHQEKTLVITFGK